MILLQGDLSDLIQDLLDLRDDIAAKIIEIEDLEDLLEILEQQYEDCITSG